MRHEYREELETIIKICEQHKNINWWLKTYLDIEITLEKYEDVFSDDGITVTARDIFVDILENKYGYWFPHDKYMDEWVNGQSFDDYCRDLQVRLVAA